MPDQGDQLRRLQAELVKVYTTIGIVPDAPPEMRLEALQTFATDLAETYKSRIAAIQRVIMFEVERVAMAEITFERAWMRMVEKGFQYGDDALAQVSFGFDLALEEMARAKLAAHGIDADQEFGRLIQALDDAYKNGE